MAGRSEENDLLTGFFGRSALALELAAKSCEFMSSIAAIALAIETSLRASGKLIIAGNGGSAADAQHLAGEFLSRFVIDRRPLPAVALTTDLSVLTAIGNDFGFENVFERQVRGLGRPGDVFLAISTSGRSRNILLALQAARKIGLVTVGLSGMERGEMQELCRYFLAAPSRETAIIQQIHIVAEHAICALVESAMVHEKHAVAV